MRRGENAFITRIALHFGAFHFDHIISAKAKLAIFASAEQRQRTLPHKHAITIQVHNARQNRRITFHSE